MSIDSLRAEYKEKAKTYLNKHASQADIDILSIIKLNKLLSEKKSISLEKYSDLLEKVGIDVTGRKRAGTYYQVDTAVLEYYSKIPGIEILSLEDALDEYGREFLEYYWRALRVDKDIYTALAELYGKGGYVIIVKEGYKIKQPIQSCLLITSNNVLQAPHNIIILEPNSEAHVVTGCAIMREVIALHAGISEFYVGENAKLSYIMIHGWGENMYVRPRTGVIVEKGGEFVSNYINMTPVKSLQSYPTVRLVGEKAKAYFSSIIVTSKSSHIDLGNEIIFEAPDTAGEIISRVVAKDNAIGVTRGRLLGKAPGVKGHLECMGLLLSNNAKIVTIPELEAAHSDVELTHEASIGKIAEDEILYLMARGFTREEAESF
ncbi:MAG: SufB/SufD family protein, partial [Candidatus Njordarchaeales archaeon]